MDRLETRIQEITDWLKDSAGEELEVGEPKSDLESGDHEWVVSAEGDKIGSLCIAEGRLGGDADVAAELERQEWLGCIREHTRCRLDSDGTLAPYLGGGGV
ncbi:MAG: hypothetical protein GWN99_04550 [Gemmatimonadetes bacterium]|uniref:Uncharacterized protein n=1 Tax=Candidatus Kutchimonas denitrificans TaxID=3056748 RepID=A0AAE5C9Q0_9BACT|nr:hypothetical protein [Gemmatimonadota bacterium]NIR75721.1 hypothetical protein [Candidatus Kutchimonas denitrificans]NIS00334.1 hypothetical protein [Gemmatimonadota bacterium]NIT65993.1 hypothetical protein [Gemmatimonadota bacterium]NIU53697.1 hypothetical protein [Gemmatimonadota bacterium]